MEKKYTIFDFFGQIVVIFGISVLCLMMFVFLFGEDAGGMSSIFSLGNDGLALSTMAQFLLMAVVITVVRLIFFTDILWKTGSVLKRTIGMFVTVVIAIGLFAAVFGWFPVNEGKPWLMFFLCFFVCSTVSVTLSMLKEKKENEKMQEALERLKKGEM